MTELLPVALHSGARTVMLGLACRGVARCLWLGTTQGSLTTVISINALAMVGAALTAMGLWRLGRHGAPWIRILGTSSWVGVLLVNAGAPLFDRMSATLDWAWLANGAPYVAQAFLLGGWLLVLLAGLRLGVLLGLRLHKTLWVPGTGMALLLLLLLLDPAAVSPTAVLATVAAIDLALAVWLWPLERATHVLAEETSRGEWSISQGFHLLQAGLVAPVIVGLLAVKYSAALSEQSVSHQLEAMRATNLGNAFAALALALTIAEAARRCSSGRAGLILAAILSALPAAALLAGRAALGGPDVAEGDVSSYGRYELFASVVSSFGLFVLAVTVKAWGKGLDRMDVVRWASVASVFVGAALISYLLVVVATSTPLREGAALLFGVFFAAVTIGAQLTVFAAVGSLRFALTESQAPAKPPNPVHPEGVDPHTRRGSVTPAELERCERAAIVHEVLAMLRKDVGGRFAAIQQATYFLKKALGSSGVLETDPKVPRFVDMLESEMTRADEALKGSTDTIDRLHKRKMASIDVSACAHAALALVDDSQRKRVTWAGRAAAALTCEPTEVALMILCLLRNALEASGRAQILVSGDSQRVTVEIANVAELTADQVGTMLELLHTTKGAGHLGLGLNIARGVARRHGGKLTLESNDGTVVAIARLPVRPGVMLA